MRKLFLALFACVVIPLQAQEYFPVNESVRNVSSRYTAFKNAKIFVTPTNVINNGTLLIKDGQIVGVGSSVSIPQNCTVIDVTGKSLYASFIDLYSGFGIKKPTPANFGPRSAIYDSKRTGYYWNEHIKSEANAFDVFSYDNVQAEEYLKLGFGVVGTHIQDGVARGTGMLVALNNADAAKRLLSEKASNHLSFSRSSTSFQMYPTSLMGTIALLRQMYHDMKWYHATTPAVRDMSLEAMQQNSRLPQIFASEDKLNSIRAYSLGKEFGINYILKGSGNEFERIDEIVNTKSKFIIPINFPEPYDMSDPHLAAQADLAYLRYWNQAPANLKVLSENKVIFAVTTDKLEKLEHFRTNLLKAIKYGFDKTRALESLTTIPASMIGKSTEIGSLIPGSLANFIITSGDIFDEKTVLFENWVQGSKYVINDKDIRDIRGSYELTLNNQRYIWKIEGELVKPNTEITDAAGAKLNSKLSFKDNWVSAILKPADSSKTTFTRLNGFVSNTDSFSGNALMFDGSEIPWTAKKTAPFVQPIDSTEASRPNKVLAVTFPNLPFGNKKKLAAETLLFKGATVWTNENDGIMTDTDVLVKNGKIAAIGKNLSDGSAKVVNAQGKHLTSGIIDEHSHIAISRGVNEYGHNSSAEVTIEDVVDPEDINIYRDLAGGVTIAQLLHGSANPIGGRSAIIKMKWGAPASEMLYKDQPKFIKFALGENVKQSNFNFDVPSRYPQTRMGVEQVFTDYFQRARDYDAQWKKYNNASGKSKGSAPRYDVELQTMAEILNGERYITCHSYVQSEILMLMDVAKKFNFKVNTFTHILEGYKVADEMKAHGAAASTFSDWWAYKYEVNDAIPHNGPIMHRQGLLVAYNSDDAEMSRRLNQEAAKAVKYGGLSEEEAWKFVTLNPAIMLHISDKTGSIKVGKDADLVMWSDNPLSIYAKAEKTVIEGITYFDIKEDMSKRNDIRAERNELTGQLLQEKNSGMITQEPKKKDKKEYHCDTLEHN